ncbi:MAG: hypothetical protein R3A80_02445 [Bdellovibrionota bacterium]
MLQAFLLSVLFLLSLSIQASERENLEAAIERGKSALITYPIKNTPILVPAEPFKNFLAAENNNPLKKLFLGLSEAVFKIHDLKGFYKWMGLVNFNENETGIYAIPKPQDWEPEQPLGVTLIHSPLGDGLTFGCSSCHAGQFLGKSILGLPNKGIRANRTFVLAKQVLPLAPSLLFQAATGATNDERRMYHNAKGALESVRATTPLALGLDTSLAHVGRSLSTRNRNAWATKNQFYELFPRHHELDKNRADSKPAVWWNVKYKNRWLSDGSIVSGNPVITNIMWNEIGRGADLKTLDAWIDDNYSTIEDMTRAIEHTEAPKWSDFFPAESIQLASAMRGEKLFRSNCAGCHGVYEKAWTENPSLSAEELIQTTEIIYHSNTPVIDVGTDSARWEGIKELSGQLNSLALSQKHNIKIVPQKGYVPLPLSEFLLAILIFITTPLLAYAPFLHPPINVPKYFTKALQKN